MENIEKVVKNSYGTTVFRLVGDQFFFYLSESMAIGNINDIYYINIGCNNAKVYLKGGGDFTVNSVYRYMGEIKKIIEDRLEQKARNAGSISNFSRQVPVLPGHPDHPAYRDQIPHGPMPGSQFKIYQPENQETPPGAEKLIYSEEDLKGKECCGCCGQCSKHQ